MTTEAPAAAADAAADAAHLAAADDSCLSKIVAQKINDMGLPAMIGDMYIYILVGAQAPVEKY